MNLCKNDLFLVYSFITYIILCVQIILLLGNIFNKKNKNVSSNARLLYYYHIQERFTALTVSTVAYMHHGQRSQRPFIYYQLSLEHVIRLG